MNASPPWQPGGASGAVRERGHAGLAALTEAGDTAMQCTALALAAERLLRMALPGPGTPLLLVEGWLRQDDDTHVVAGAISAKAVPCC